MQRLLSLAWTSNTHETYSSGWRAFCRFLHQSTHTTHLPASIQTVREFIAWLSLQNLAPSTISTYVSGVAHFHKVRGWPDPTKDFIISKLVEGARRDKYPHGDRRVPISLPILSRIIEALPQVCTSHYENIMFRAAMLCAFFGFMRVGEFAANSKQAIQDSILQIKDIRFCLSQPTGLSVDIVLQRSKANQLGPPQLIHLSEATDKNLCPVHALHAFVIMRPKHQGILFCHFDGIPLTKFQFGAVLKKALVQAGLEGQRFRTHSVRIGAATTAFEYVTHSAKKALKSRYAVTRNGSLNMQYVKNSSQM